MSLKSFKLPQPSATKRGDTLIEVMFAIAVFSLVAVVSITMMNAGVASAERSLELVTARNELNAQAEALRFIHSSYISEKTLPTCDDKKEEGEKCQQFSELWHTITANAIDYKEREDYEDYTTQVSQDKHISKCAAVYYDDKKYLNNNKAFVINPRQLKSDNTNKNKAAYVAFNDPNNSLKFQQPELNARILYTQNTDSPLNSSSQLSSVGLSNYAEIAQIEGIWVIAVKSNATPTNGTPQYYDFYIETCWDGSGTNSSTSLDAIIRLSNPEAIQK